MSLAEFWNKTDSKVLSAIIGGAVLLLNLGINSCVNYVMLKKRVKLEIGQRWQEIQLTQTSNTLNPIIDEMVQLLNGIERVRPGNQNVINAIDSCISKLQPYRYATSKMIKIMETLHELLREDFSSNGKSESLMTQWDKKRRKYVAKVNKLVVLYKRGKF